MSRSGVVTEVPVPGQGERAPSAMRRVLRIREAAYALGVVAVSSLVRAAGNRVDHWQPVPAASPLPRSTRHRLRWWREVLYAAAFYAVYSAIRNTQGSATVSAVRAFNNARHVIRLESLLGVYHEQAVQQAFLGNRMFIGFWNFFYGSLHFVVPVVALTVLFRRFPGRYRRWRNTLALTTGLALVGFALYPLMPPRLMPAGYGFVDTLRTYGSLWSFDSGPISRISNQYAAMPSLHFAWAMWCALALVPALRATWAKVLAALYPALTLFAIVVTANHFVLDAAGGLVVLGAGALGGFALASWIDRRRLRLTGLRGPNAVTGLRGPNAVTGLRGPNAVTGLRGRGTMTAYGLR